MTLSCHNLGRRELPRRLPRNVAQTLCVPPNHILVRPPRHPGGPDEGPLALDHFTQNILYVSGTCSKHVAVSLKQAHEPGASCINVLFTFLPKVLIRADLSLIQAHVAIH